MLRARRRTVLIAASTALAVLAAGLFGGIIDVSGEPPADASSESRSPAPSAEALAALDALGISAGASRGPQTLQQLAQRAEDEPTATAFTRVGDAYMQRVRESGDPAGYAPAQAAFERAEQLDPRSYAALVGLAQIAAARHEFTDARRLAMKATKLQPASTQAYGILGDAQLELGDEEAAFETFDEMSSRKPTLASYARISYARELSGDRAGALEALDLALAAGSGAGESIAFVRALRGKLLVADNKLPQASAEYRAGMVAFPRHAPSIAGLAYIAALQGDTARAARLFERATAIVPLAEFPIAQSDMHLAAGDAAAAEQADELATALLDVQRQAGVKIDLELAIYQLDRDEQVASALAQIERVHELRTSVHVEDALGWALLKNDRCDEALQHSKRSLRLGTGDGLKLFHRAQIEQCLGGAAAARPWYRRALAADPNFSLLHRAQARAGAAA